MKMYRTLPTDNMTVIKCIQTGHEQYMLQCLSEKDLLAMTV